MAYIGLSIKKLINRIENEEYVLPAIQREFVWSASQIERLMDSILRGYPIGAFLFWEVKGESTSKYEFYEILDNYHERDSRHNRKKDISSKEKVTAILDGQQRITSLYLALHGTYSYKTKRAWTTKDDSYPLRKLYLNLTGYNKEKENDLLYDFKFLSEEDINNDSTDNLWFLVSDILNISSEDLHVKIIELHEDYKSRNENANDESLKMIVKNLSLLHQVIEKENLAYYEETSQDIEKVLDIFIRMNSGGTVLTYSDLLLSLATAQWQSLNAREEIYQIVDEINNIGEKFNFSKDNVLKSALVLTDTSNIKFRASNFDSKTTLEMERNWDKTKQALRISVELLYSFGFTGETLTANSVLIPIVYYLYKIDVPSNYIEADRYMSDRNKIKYFVQIALLKRIFGGTPDGILLKIRDKLKNANEGFPLEEILSIRETNKSFNITDEDIEDLLDSKIGRYSFSMLTMLFPSIDLKNKFHQDHIFPQSKFKNKNNLKKLGYDEKSIEYIISNVDKIPNLQLLEGIPNIEKNNKYFDEWILGRFNSKEDLTAYLERNSIKRAYKPTEFIEMFDTRKNELRNRLKINLENIRY
ncbi:DUF262 domain-containing protein [Candidatus Enterococcus willemsii]|uniref:GmrSD restriction endonucleases N-terminal domain-containing protein n=1 Tax=Candidatus Enterococcus willemsii TaxID=1857215 RepID=A0ABQ6Z063_9ENTE|nr:DUF262 domain-containing protein [Enterococcus sp. CU12B]KAF1304303.1 hypothetical protein BAU17_12075 [Enterococcus sp. CU12B]